MTICLKNTQKTESVYLNAQAADAAALQVVADACIRCGSCARECGFLQNHGTPGQIAVEHLTAGQNHFATAFSCSLCRLCSQICPKRLPVAEMFLDLRRQAVLQGGGKYKEHRRILGYEALGNSALFTDYLLPANCTTVFFPGCTLPGVRSEQTWQLFLLLQKHIPDLGIVFDCCNKPSHDLGFQGRFEKRLQPKVERLQSHGVTKIITACPSCYQIFQQYAEELEVATVYTYLVGRIPRSKAECATEYTLHDACTVRFEPEIHKAVRELVLAKGIKISEMVHSRAATLCCGEGGSAACIGGGSASDWRGKRVAEAGGLPILTFCAGCTLRLKSANAHHLLDLLFGSLPSTGVSYLNRLLLKRKIAGYLRKICK